MTRDFWKGGFTAADFLSDREIDKSIREIFPEWKEIITKLAAHHADRANGILKAELEKAPMIGSRSKRGVWSKGLVTKPGIRYSARLVRVELVK